MLHLSLIGYIMRVREAKDLGYLVKDVRSQRRITQADLAAQVGASRKWIIDLEAGKNTADLSLVLRTLNVLGIELDARPRRDRQGKDADINTVVDAARRPRK